MRTFDIIAQYKEGTMCDELIYCTCEMHDLAVEERRALDPDFKEPEICKAYLVKYTGRKLSLRPVCELCAPMMKGKELMDLEMAIKHRDLSRGYRAKPRLVENASPADPAVSQDA